MPLGTTWGTHWEPGGNLKGTWKNEKNPLPDCTPPPSKPFKTKKSRHFE